MLQIPSVVPLSGRLGLTLCRSQASSESCVRSDWPSEMPLNGRARKLLCSLTVKASGVCDNTCLRTQHLHCR